MRLMKSLHLRVYTVNNRMVTFNYDRRKVGLIGIEEDRNGSYLRGPSKAPNKIREAIAIASSNTYCEYGYDTDKFLQDIGNIDIPTISDSPALIKSIHSTIFNTMQNGFKPLIFLGGDHSITFPIIKTITQFLPTPVTIVHFDAHPDIYPNFENNPSSHASPFARILEDPSLCHKLISVGIRTVNDIQREQWIKYNVSVIEAKDFPSKGNEIKDFLTQFISEDTSVYISIDLDVIEPGLAPGISHPEAGGLSVRQLVDAIHSIPGKIIGADIVEYNPDRDINNITAAVASKLVKEVVGQMIVSNRLYSL
eukprot:gene4417-6244_t